MEGTFSLETVPLENRERPRGTKKASLVTTKRIADALGVPVQNLFYPPKEPIAYLKSEQDLFTRRLEGLVRDRGDNFRKLLWKVANYLAKEEKGK